MRYLVIYRSQSSEEGGMPDAAHMKAMGDMIHEWMSKGVLVTTEPLGVRTTGAKLRLSNGDYTLGDQTERASGYAILNANSRDEIIDHCRYFLGRAGDGLVEIHQIVDMGGPPPA